ncbi:hypothetical protein CW748_09215 [Alteromonadales bacterium alter-6D02]|nr:hypothetical protein CW748_09215 [Alteromonadales bacterium alter-6D02]
MSKWLVSIMAFTIICITLLFINDEQSSEKTTNVSVQPLVVTSETLPKIAIQEVVKKSADAKIIDNRRPLEIVEGQEEHYIVECEPELLPELLPETKQEGQIRQSYVQSLSSSSLPSKQLAYALFSVPPDDKSRLDLLSSFNGRFPHNSIVLMEMINLCTASLTHPACNQTLLENATDIDGNNGALWYQIANYHAASGNELATLNAMREVTKSTHFNERFFSDIEVYMQALKGSGVGNHISNRSTAIGINAAKPMNVSAIVKFCRQKESYDDITANLCLELGQLLEVQAKTLFNSHIGIALQDFVHLAEHNEDALKDNKHKKDKLRKEAFTKQFDKAMTLTWLDENLYWYLVKVRERFGEKEAANLLVKEAISRSQREDYDPCPTTNR